MFVIAPIAAVAVLAVAVRLDLWVIVPVAAVWNTVHTVQQRYGLLGIYAGKAGYGSARLDRAVVYLPPLAVLAVVAVQDRTADQLDAVASTFGGNNSAGVRLLLDNRTPLLIALPVLVGLALVTVAIYVTQERNSSRADPAKWGYLAGSAALLGAVLVDPLAGLVAYVAAHALEYVVVVSRTLARRYPHGGGAPGPLAVFASGPVRRQVLLWGFLAILAGGVVLAREVLNSRNYLVLIYTVGVLHFTFDAVIWKVRRPAVKADFGIPRG